MVQVRRHIFGFAFCSCSQLPWDNVGVRLVVLMYLAFHFVMQLSKMKKHCETLGKECESYKDVIWTKDKALEVSPIFSRSLVMFSRFLCRRNCSDIRNHSGSTNYVCRYLFIVTNTNEIFERKTRIDAPIDRVVIVSSLTMTSRLCADVMCSMTSPGYAAWIRPGQ